MENKLFKILIEIIYPSICLILSILFKNFYFLLFGIIGYELLNIYFLKSYNNTSVSNG